MTRRTLIQSVAALVPGFGSVELEEVPGFAPPGTIEIAGLSAGEFDPWQWRRGETYWVSDVRQPFIAARRGGVAHNIYAPYVLCEPDFWRVYYGGWDGALGDRVYGLTTKDFIDFTDRELLIDRGWTPNINDPNVQRTEDGVYHMITIINGVVNAAEGCGICYFSSRDGHSWNGALPYTVQRTDQVVFENYDAALDADNDSTAVLFNHHGRLVLYYMNFRGPDDNLLMRAEAVKPPVFRFTHKISPSGRRIQDLRCFVVDGREWYLTLYTWDINQIVYSISTDETIFSIPSLIPLYKPEASYLSWAVTPTLVVRGNSVPGMWFGGGELARNHVYARWLQKKLEFVTSGGYPLETLGALGPDRIRLALPGTSPVTGEMRVYDDDGFRLLRHSTGVELRAGRIYRLVWG